MKQTSLTLLCFSIVLLWPEEWTSLSQWYTDEDKPVCLLAITDKETVRYTSSPGKSVPYYIKTVICIVL